MLKKRIMIGLGVEFCTGKVYMVLNGRRMKEVGVSKKVGPICE